MYFAISDSCPDQKCKIQRMIKHERLTKRIVPQKCYICGSGET